MGEEKALAEVSMQTQAFLFGATFVFGAREGKCKNGAEFRILLTQGLVFRCVRNTIAGCRKRWQRYAAGGTVTNQSLIALNSWLRMKQLSSWTEHVEQASKAQRSEKFGLEFREI